VLPVSVCERMDRRRGLGVGVGWLGHLLLGGAEKRVPSPCANEFAKKKYRGAIMVRGKLEVPTT
jgi:hypothetical protein